MPRGNPKLPIMLRITRELRDAVGAYGVPFTQAVEEGLDLWLAREKRRKAAKPDPLARHLAPPTARERAVRRGTQG
jgi:hypothetical protein